MAQIKWVLIVGLIDAWGEIAEKRMDTETVVDQQQWEVITLLMININLDLK